MRSNKNNLLRFDFGIISDGVLVCLVEFDGKFHYEKLYDDDGHETLKLHDELKNNYCDNNNIPLLRIPYWDFDDIETIILKNILPKINGVYNEL